jgi:hypothetical protein
MLHPLLRTLVKVVLASLLLGAVLSHFGITTDELMSRVGVTQEQIEDYARRGIAWAIPNVLLGSLIIVPLWFVIYLFSPPRRSSE